MSLDGWGGAARKGGGRHHIIGVLSLATNRLPIIERFVTVQDDVVECAKDSSNQQQAESPTHRETPRTGVA